MPRDDLSVSERYGYVNDSAPLHLVTNTVLKQLCGDEVRPCPLISVRAPA